MIDIKHKGPMVVSVIDVEDKFEFNMDVTFLPRIGECLKVALLEKYGQESKRNGVTELIVERIVHNSPKLGAIPDLYVRELRQVMN